MAEDKQFTEDNTITLTDENGNEVNFGILFTYHHDENGKDYVVIYPLDQMENSEEDLDIYAYAYTVSDDGVGDLYAIEDEEENKMIDEVINQYFEDLDAEEQDA